MKVRGGSLTQQGCLVTAGALVVEWGGREPTDGRNFCPACGGEGGWCQGSL